MKGMLVRISEGGCFLTYLIKTEEGVWCRTYSGKGYGNFDRWKNLKEGDRLVGLKWKNKAKKIIDADSNVSVL